MFKRALKPVLGPIYRKACLPLLHRSVAFTFQSSTFIARKLSLIRSPASSVQIGKESFLIVSLTPHLGDTIMKMPMIEALRNAHPQARIECAVEASAAPLLRMMPAVDRVYALNLGHIPPTTKWLSIKRVLLATYRYLQTMRQSAPTVCIMPRWGDDLFQSCVVGYLAGAPRRIGFAVNAKVPRERPFHYRDALLTEQIEGGSGIHEPERFCLLLRESGLLPPSEAGEGKHEVGSLKHIAAMTDWQALAKRVRIDTSLPFAVIAPGASMPKRVWPLESWAEVIEDLRLQGMQVVLLSGAQDAAIAKRLHLLTGKWATLIAGETNLAESVTLISRASLFLGNDSGPGHIAGALGVPTVILFIAERGCDPDGPSAPERIHPIGPRVASCRPPKCIEPCVQCCEASEAHCIRTIQPRDVIAAAIHEMARSKVDIGMETPSEVNP